MSAIPSVQNGQTAEPAAILVQPVALLPPHAGPSSAAPVNDHVVMLRESWERNGRFRRLAIGWD
jgi:hypothetical protein